jgi:hypothetical protein
VSSLDLVALAACVALLLIAAWFTGDYILTGLRVSRLKRDGLACRRCGG